MSDNIEKLKSDIEKAEAEARPPVADPVQADNMRRGVVAGTELVSCIAGGAFIGWLLDRWLETKPAFLICFLLLGVCAAFFNVYKLTQGAGQGIGSAPLHKREKQAKQAPED